MKALKDLDTFNIDVGCSQQWIPASSMTPQHHLGSTLPCKVLVEWSSHPFQMFISWLTSFICCGLTDASSAFNCKVFPNICTTLWMSWWSICESDHSILTPHDDLSPSFGFGMVFLVEICTTCWARNDYIMLCLMFTQKAGAFCSISFELVVSNMNNRWAIENSP